MWLGEGADTHKSPWLLKEGSNHEYFIIADGESHVQKRREDAVGKEASDES